MAIEFTKNIITPIIEILNLLAGYSKIAKPKIFANKIMREKKVTKEKFLTPNIFPACVNNKKAIDGHEGDVFIHYGTLLNIN